MLEGVHGTAIIAGAYTNGDGICPMLAAHRAGGRTNASSFARVWDRFAFRGARVTRPRPATARELLILSTQLEASLMAEDTPDGDLAAAIVSHQALVTRRVQRPEREPRSRPGWSWMRVVRSYDEYQRVLDRLEQERTTLEECATPAGRTVPPARALQEPGALPERPRELV
jgi:hypothetical protein